MSANIEQATIELKRTDEQMQNKMINDLCKYSVRQRIKDVVMNSDFFGYLCDPVVETEYFVLCDLFIYLLDNNEKAIESMYNDLRASVKERSFDHRLCGLYDILGNVLPERMDLSIFEDRLYKHLIKKLQEEMDPIVSSAHQLVLHHFFGFLIGACHQFGIGVTIDVKRAYEAYTIASHSSDFTNWQGSYDVFGEDDPCPLPSYIKASTTSDPCSPKFEVNYLPAIVLCGLCCEYGIGAPKDREKALKHYVDAGINGGDPQALHLIVRCLDGKDLTEKYLNSMVPVVRPERRRRYTPLKLLELAVDPKQTVDPKRLDSNLTVDPNRFVRDLRWFPEEGASIDLFRIKWIDGNKHSFDYPRALRELGIWYLCGINVKVDYDRAIHYLGEAEKSHYNWAGCEYQDDSRKEQSPAVKLMRTGGKPFVPNGKDYLLSTLHKDWAYSLAIEIISFAQKYDPWHATHCLSLIKPRGQYTKPLRILTFCFNQFRPDFPRSLLELVAGYWGEEETIPKATAKPN